MTTTEHYNLKTYEGTDKFNPITVENANSVIIDGALKDNADAGVTLATELTNAHVHAITRTKATAMFRFVATSKFELGDTITVDGVQVTALMTDGTTIPDGAYVIGSNVLACLVGTSLTLFVAKSSIAEAENSLKLGGELPSYYGKASDVENAVNTSVSASNIANGVNNLLKNLPSGVLTAGQTTLVISDTSIRANGLVDIYTSQFGVFPTNAVTTNGTITLTFKPIDTNLTVKVRCIS